MCQGLNINATYALWVVALVDLEIVAASVYPLSILGITSAVSGSHLLQLKRTWPGSLEMDNLLSGGHRSSI